MFITYLRFGTPTRRQVLMGFSLHRCCVFLLATIQLTIKTVVLRLYSAESTHMAVVMMHAGKRKPIYAHGYQPNFIKRALWTQPKADEAHSQIGASYHPGDIRADSKALTPLKIQRRQQTGGTPPETAGTRKRPAFNAGTAEHMPQCLRGPNTKVPFCNRMRICLWPLRLISLSWPQLLGKVAPSLSGHGTQY